MTHLPFLASGLAALISLTAVQAQSPMLWSDHPAVTPAAASWNNAETASSATLVETQFVRLDMATLRQRSDASVQLVLFGNTYTCKLLGSTRSLRHDLIRGSIAGKPEATVLFAVSDTQDIVAGAFEIDGQTYGLHYANDADIHVLQRFDLSLETRRCATTGPGADPRRAAHTHSTSAQVGNTSTGPSIAFAPGAANDTVIDVAVFYTPQARAGAGSAASMESQIALRVGSANIGSNDSNVLHEYRLVHTSEVSYTELGNSGDLDRFRSTNDGFMDNVHGIRSQVGADIMNLITNRAGFCGVGYLMTRNTTSFRSSAFNVTVRGCLPNNTMTHEMGHNMGCAHDRNNANGGLYSFSFGARTSGNGFRSIMAYAPGQRVNRWSRNGGTWNGLALGDASNDNARGLNTVRATLRNFAPTRTFEFCEHSGGINGQFGRPRIEGAGTETAVTPVDVTLRLSRIGAPGVLFIGASALNAPLFGGVLVPQADIQIPVVGNVGPNVINLDGIRAIGPGLELWFQAWYVDPAGSGPGLSATNGMSVRTL